MKRVEGEQHLYRNDSGAIVSTDTNGYNNYIRMKEERHRQKMEIQEMKKDIGEIKSLLMELINGPRQN
jgi:hypothetical protein